MKISHRLMAMTAFTSLGLAAVAGLGYFAVTSIQGDLRDLTLQATPLQNRTYELQERTERGMGALLRLSLARSPDEAAKGSAAFDAEMKALDGLVAEISKLDRRQQTDLGAFRQARAQIADAVGQRLQGDAAYRQQTEQARSALTQAEQAITATRAAVGSIETEAGRSADKAQEAGRGIAAATKAALVAQARLKELVILASDTDLVGNRFRIAPLKERLKASVDGLQRMALDGPQAELIKTTQAVVASVNEGFVKEGTGLFALRVDVLAGKKEQEAAYQAQRKAVLKPLEDEGNRLGAAVDTLEVQGVKQRQALEAALRFRNEPGGVVAAADAITLDMKEMTATLRLLMLAASNAEAQPVEASLQTLSQRMGGHVDRLRTGLQKMGKPQLVANVDAAAAALKLADAAVAQVAQAKRSVLGTDQALQRALADLKTVAARQAEQGAVQVRSITDRQQQVVATVDRRVQQSLGLILAISGAIILVAAVGGVLTVRAITRRLDMAVRVAEAVSQGRLDAVPQAEGNDETARLLAAMATMVQTLQAMLAQIRHAGEAIQAGSQEMVQGNQDLSSRTEQQACRLQQTVSSMRLLTESVRSNSEAARQVDVLATDASHAASGGGDAVARVVATMDQIQAGSQRIADIVGVIDGIAFQTNILALNAAVEAARAGEHGRGFAVVASEVRALAGKSAQAAQQVKDIIAASVDQVQAGTGQVRDAGQTIAAVVTRVHEVSALIQTIAQSSQGQSLSLGEVSQAIELIDSMTQRNAVLAEQGTSASQQLHQQAEGLMQAVSVFKVAAH